MSKITKSAKGQACMIRIPGVCCFDSETTVFAHINGYGIGGKNPDFLGSYACAKCHDAVDHRSKVPYTNEEIKAMFYEGVFRTQRLLFDAGLIKIK